MPGNCKTWTLDWTGLDWTGLDWICACALKYCYSCSVQLYTTSLNMDVVAVSSDSECESEVIRPTSAVVFTPTSLNMDVVVHCTGKDSLTAPVRKRLTLCCYI